MNPIRSTSASSASSISTGPTTSPRYKRNGDDFIPGHQLAVPVNKDNAIRSGIVPESMRDSMSDFISLSISGNNLSKFDLIMLDILANYDWSRPIYFVSRNETKLGLEPWLQYDGMVYKLVPFLNEAADRDATMVHWDYQNIFTFSAVVPLRDIFVTTATALIEKGETEKAERVLDKCVESLPAKNFPYNVSMFHSLNEWSVLGIVEDYFRIGRPDKALAVGNQLGKETIQMMVYYSTPEGPDEDDVLDKRGADDSATLFYYLIRTYNNFDCKDEAKQLESMLKEY